MAERVGVYICHCGTNIADTVDVEEVRDFASKLDDVVLSRDYEFMCSDPGQDMIREDIEKEDLTKVVVASCSPLLHEGTFMEVVESAGLNRFEFQQANIREQCSWVTDDKEKATEKAKRLVKAAVNRVRRHEPLKVREVRVEPRVLVVGGGIAGIEAALDVAESDKEAYLVEKSPSIGGHMAQLDKTFPTLDCSSCILTPKMSDAGHHPNINLMTYSEVESVEGFPGNFTVKIRRKARMVDEEKCTGCGVCGEICPVSVPNEFDEGIGDRSAVYIPFPQAVPMVPVIDEENCIYFETGKCKACEQKCPADAIDFDQDDQIEEVSVGNIIVATGYEPFDPSLKPELGYEYDNVITGLEFERLASADGPADGKIQLADGDKPKNVVFVHCVGSRDKSVGNPYCSRVCCMYTAKHAHQVKERIPDAKVTVFYTDVRAFGKGYEEFYDRVRSEGVLYRRGNVAEVNKDGDKLFVKAEDTFLGEIVEVEADLVVLAVGLVPRTSSDDLVGVLNLSKSEEGFLSEAHPKLRPLETSVDGIFLAGCCQFPKDIPDSVAQGAGAAEKAIAMIDGGSLKLDPYISEIDEDVCAGCKTCISVCPFDAAEFDEEKGVARIEETLCKGCGACVASCPSGAAHQRGFSDRQLVTEMLGILA